MENSNNSSNNNLNEEDEIYDEICEIAQDQLREMLYLLRDTTGNNELENKKAFFYILLNDVIGFDTSKILHDSEFSSDDILSIMYKEIDDSIDILENKVSNKSNSQIKEIKALFSKKKKIISKKLTDCNKSLNILKKAYLNKNIGDYFGNINTNSLNFKSANVLHSDIDKINNQLGEFFARAIFLDIQKDEDPRQAVPNYLQSDFYSQANIVNSFRLNQDEFRPATELDNMSNNFKYWVILFFLISQIFSEKPDYNKLLKKNSFIKFITELKKNPEKKSKKKHKGGAKSKKTKKSTKSKKGNNLIKFLNQQKKSNSTKISSNKLSNPRDIFKGVLKVIVNNGVDNRSLEMIYFNSVSETIKNYEKHYIENHTTIYHNVAHALLNPPVDKNFHEIKLQNPFKPGETKYLNELSKSSDTDIKKKKTYLSWVR